MRQVDILVGAAYRKYTADGSYWTVRKQGVIIASRRPRFRHRLSEQIATRCLNRGGLWFVQDAEDNTEGTLLWPVGSEC